jgi:hypothetical protein
MNKVIQTEEERKLKQRVYYQENKCVIKLQQQLYKAKRKRLQGNILERIKQKYLKKIAN